MAVRPAVSVPWVALDRFKGVVVCSTGCVAGIVWWLIAQPSTSIGSTALAVGMGALLALFGALGLRLQAAQPLPF